MSKIGKAICFVVGLVAYYRVTPPSFDRETGSIQIAIRRNNRLSPRDKKIKKETVVK